MKPRILLPTISAPPKSGAESIQVARILEALAPLTKEIVLVTTRAPKRGWTRALSHPSDLELPNLVSLRYLLDQTDLGRLAQGLLSRLPDSLTCRPDRHFIFHWQWLRLRCVKSFDLIYSRSGPLSSTILGYKLARFSKKPWVLHLSDPWQGDTPKNRYNLEMEKRCFELADRICLTTPETITFYEKRFPFSSKKLRLFPNVHAGTISKEIHPTGGRLTLLYAGNLYGGRTIKPILDAFDDLDPVTKEQLQFHVIGNVDDMNHRLLTNAGNKYVKWFGPLSPDLASKAMQQADVLVSIDLRPQEEMEKCYLPSKIQDYIALRKPILCISSVDSSSWNFVNYRHGHCFSHNDVPGISQYLKVLVTNGISRSFISNNLEELERYSPRVQASRLISMFKKLLN